jgi:hypothetical protein
MTLITIPGNISHRELVDTRNTYRGNYSQMLERYADEFPLLLTMPANAMDNGGPAWLVQRLGEVTEGWRVVPQWPDFQHDTFMFRERDRDIAVLFKLSF